MKKKKAVAYIIGATCAIAVILGIIMLFSPKVITVSAAIAIICLSLASGLIIPNPISFLGLIAGICMLILPPWIVGIIFICAGIAGAVANIFISKKKLKV